MKVKIISILVSMVAVLSVSADANQDRRIAEDRRSFNNDINRNAQKQQDFQRQVQQNYQNRQVTPPYVPPRPVYNRR